MVSPLREFLERTAGEKSLEFIIPHPFLPPRFQKVCQNRNMVLLLDTDFNLHVRWEGAQSYHYSPLTPGKARHLLREVFRKMKKYRKDLEVYGRFIESWAENPLRNEGGGFYEDEEENEIVAVLSEEGVIEGCLQDLLENLSEGIGGESPLPNIDYEERG